MEMISVADSDVTCFDIDISDVYHFMPVPISNEEVRECHSLNIL